MAILPRATMRPARTVWNERAAVSIAVYHLNHYKLRRRRRGIYNDLKLLIQEGDLLYDKAVTNQP